MSLFSKEYPFAKRYLSAAVNLYPPIWAGIDSSFSERTITELRSLST